MSVNFSFCGKLKKLNEKENFKPLDTKTFESGFSVTTMKFNASNGTNKHFMQIKSFAWLNADGSINEDKTEIYTSKAPVNNKSENIKVAYTERNDPEVLKKVAAFKKFVIDLNKPGEEKKEELRREYIYEGDFITALNNVLSNEEYASAKFYVRGAVDIQYSDSKETFYRAYIPQRIGLAAEDEPEKMELSDTFYFNEYAWDDENYSDTGRVRLSCYARVYDRQYAKDSCKGWISCPFEFVLIPSTLVNDKCSDPEEILRVYKGRIGKPVDGAVCSKVQITADVIDGAQVEQLTFEDLPEDVREDIEMGLADLETELRRANSAGGAYGNRITEYRIKSIRGAEATNYDDSFFQLPVHDAVATSTNASKAKEETATKNTDDFDVFDI